MAADTNNQYITSGHPGGFTQLKQAVNTVTFVAGKVTITPSDFGLTSIVHVIPGMVWGITTATGFIMGSTTSFVAAGTTGSILLELIEDDGTALDATNTCSVLVFGT